MAIFTHTISTETEELVDIAAQVRSDIRESGVREGLCVVHCPHTTAAVTVNENADPDVQRDLLLGLAAAFPDRADFRHFEGNSAAHLKSSALGCTQTLLVEKGAPVLGRWQGVYFCEFDGPRTRTYHVKVLAG